jgi:hypothetical protein
LYSFGDRKKTALDLPISPNPKPSQRRAELNVSKLLKPIEIIIDRIASDAFQCVISPLLEGSTSWVKGHLGAYFKTAFPVLFALHRKGYERQAEFCEFNPEPRIFDLHLRQT